MSVSESEVRLELGNTDLSDSDLQTFINKARRFYEAEAPTGGLTTERKDDVVTAIAAHFVATGPERQPDSVSGDDGSVTYAGESGQGLAETSHGRKAVDLDPTGALNLDEETSTDFVGSR